MTKTISETLFALLEKTHCYCPRCGDDCTEADLAVAGCCPHCAIRIEREYNQSLFMDEIEAGFSYNA